ncbi:c-type cytochrome [Colwellia hornerae]|uniref:Cytochrome c n=1 Tax=Colwellia hornerae TaxID=89402 RepID=A0A5C6Q3H9_9GAMM|nr:cytochrome c [Colwellia hornerae]TWX47420.1 cytochrome c [Colwellia hornerae]TWX54700.1 cytochrome c [Colwellia hornerae]TWX63413.1 cytochrome c [Colwellia hornerae]
MKLFTKVALASVFTVMATGAIANTASSLKHAEKATELRQSIFSLLGSNMGPLGGMAKGKIELDAEKVAKHALRINQLSMMIADYTRTDTSTYKVKTEALNKIWQQPDAFSKRIKDLTQASASLQTAALSGDESLIKKAIGGVGKTCGGCHDDFKAE